MRWGRAACPPTPSMSIVRLSVEAMIGPLRMPNSPGRHAGEIVHAVDLLDAEAVHQPVLDHGEAAGAALLRRLEDHHRRTGEVAGLGEIARRAQQHRGMAVMAAGVHLAGHRRLVGDVVRLLQRQGVHVGAQPDHLARAVAGAADDADHAGAPDPRHHLVAAERLELLGDRRGGAVHIVEQLGMGMDVAPPGGDLGMEVGNTIDDRHLTAPMAPRTGRLPVTRVAHGLNRCTRALRRGARKCQQNRLPAGGQGAKSGRRGHWNGCRRGFARGPDVRLRRFARSAFHRLRWAQRGDARAFAIDRSSPRFYTRRGEPVAQTVEHLTFNQVVLGSSPSRLTNQIKALARIDQRTGTSSLRAVQRQPMHVPIAFCNKVLLGAAFLLHRGIAGKGHGLPSSPFVDIVNRV